MNAVPRQIMSASIATAVSLAILVSLGLWQVQRLRWKEALLAEIDQSERAPAVQLGAAPARFSKVFVAGNWRPGSALYGSDVRSQPNGATMIGAQRLQLLARADGSLIVVDQGWVPTAGAIPAEARGAARVEGYVRAPEHPGLLSAEDNPAQRRFYSLDPAAIGAALGAPVVAPFTLVALGRPVAGAPIPAESLPRPPNNHLQYAFTWFGLAASLVGVYAAWIGRMFFFEKKNQKTFAP